MTPAEQRAAIAEVLGIHADKWWCPECQREVEPVEVTHGERHDYQTGGCGETVEERNIPDYLNDLNAMHVAEQALSVNEWSGYLDALDRICVPVHICPTTHSLALICSTAAERARAFLCAKGLWKEETK